MRAAITLLLFCAAPAVAAGAPAAPAAAAPYDDAACASCHGAVTARKTLHRPVAEGRGCAACHLPKGGAGKCRGTVSAAWRLAAPDPSLCARCHDVSGRAPMHPAIQALGCGACHEPHGSDNPKLLRRAGAAMCAECHDPVGKKKEVHTALTTGDCLDCHDPHAGEAAPLLKKARRELCFDCHDAAGLFAKRVQHAPVAEGRCAECHDPHASDHPKHLRAEGKALCLRCHDARAKSAPDCGPRGKCVDLAKKTVHPALEIADCQECHAPGHSADHPKLLVKRPPDLCYGCHDRKDAQAFTHGAVRVGDCAQCHDPHSSAEPKLLRNPIDRGLCFRCHANDVERRAFIHAPVASGDCTHCHDPHGAPNAFNLKAGTGKQVCYACHEVKDDVKVKHRALERGGCTACHDPHGTANRFQLLKPVNALCQSCHADKVDGTHVTTFVPGGHKIAGGPDPHDVQKDFSCVSCHNPHGSNSARLLRFGAESSEFCDWCHGDRSGKRPELVDITRRRRPAPGAPAATPAAASATPAKDAK